MIGFLPACGIALACSVAAVHAPAANTRFARFFQNVMGQPWKTLKAPFEHYLGAYANRFNLNGPVGIVADAIQKLKETTKVSSLLHLQEPENSGFDTPFSVFSNGEALKCAKEVLRHTTDALVRFPEMAAWCTARFNKNTNNALASSSENIRKFFTDFRTMILPRFQEATL
jgi:hypothetical protein